VTAEASSNAARPTDEIVDVLIVGAGASGAAVAWSLAETRMKILCLEQGDWIKSTEFPSNGCKRNIEMTPLCKIEVTLPRVLGSGEVRLGGVVDEQAGVQPA